MSDKAALLVLGDERLALDAVTLERLADVAAHGALRLLEQGNPIAPDLDRLIAILSSAEARRGTPKGGALEAGDAGLQDGRAVEQPGLLSRAQAAKALGIGLTKLRDLDRDGYLKPVRIGRRVLYRPEDIEEFENANQDR